MIAFGYDFYKAWRKSDIISLVLFAIVPGSLPADVKKGTVETADWIESAVKGYLRYAHVCQDKFAFDVAYPLFCHVTT